jgi:acyl-CoA synthetase (AMP-forming)/AMP-acid ligase II/3-hydroxymyristoyl/3-hydroxydecanoyl-(acyl carrier protein) dehydratase
VKHAIERYQVSDLVTVPAHISALLAAGTPLAPLERVVSSGAVLEPTLAEEFARHSGAQVIDVLGSTESGGIAWRNPCVGAPYVPLPGVSVAADPNGQLLLCSPFLATDDWETMNDRVRMVPGGFEHLGRRDGVIKLGGKRLAMQELELRARGLPGINDAVGLVQPSTRLRGTEVWLAVATTDQSWDAGALKQALAQYFDPAVLPRRYRICETLPRNALGKVERSQLVQLFSASGPTPETCFQLPKPDVKQDAEAELFVSNFKVPVTWVYFCGHFPNAPILPGVVQLSEIVLPSIALAWRELRILDEAPVLKYQRPIQPGMQLALHACRQRGGSQVQFELRAGNELASTGRLRFRTL